MSQMQRATPSGALRCMVCGDPVDMSEAVRVGATVCQKRSCHETKNRILREARKVLFCSLCGRPSSARERAANKRFRLAESVLAHIFYPKLFKSFQANGGSVEDFNRLVQEVPGFVSSDARTKDAMEIKTSLEENSESIADAIRHANSSSVQADPEGDPA